MIVRDRHTSDHGRVVGMAASNGEIVLLIQPTSHSPEGHVDVPGAALASWPASKCVLVSDSTPLEVTVVGGHMDVDVVNHPHVTAYEPR